MFLKRFVMVFVISFLASNLFAQGAYFNINTGYGFSMSSQNISFLDVDFHNHSSSFIGGNYTFSNEQVNVSLGKGFDIGGTYGYMFNENLGVELDISYLIGSQYKVTREFESDARTDSIEYALSSNMLRFNPSIVITSGFEKFNPYAKFGMIIGVGRIMYEKKRINMHMTYIKEENTMKFNGGIALGLSSSIGVMYDLNDKMSLFGEAKMINLSYAPEKGEMTEHIVNGEDRLSELTTREKEIDFVDSYTENYGTNTTPESEPRKELKQKFPYGSLSVNVGFMLSL